MEGKRAIIALDSGECSDPLHVVAIAAHELSHFRLLGERRLSPDRADGERLTDLLTIYFGFGIFSTNAAMRFARTERGWVAIPTEKLNDRELNSARRGTYHRLGYLSSEEFGYALSCYAWVRRERDPGWARYVNPGPLVCMAQGLGYLARTSAGGSLPAQRVLAKMGTDRRFTVRTAPTPGKAGQGGTRPGLPGPSGLTRIAPGHGPGQDAQRGAERALGQHRQDPGTLPGRID